VAIATAIVAAYDAIRMYDRILLPRSLLT